MGILEIVIRAPAYLQRYPVLAALLLLVALLLCALFMPDMDMVALVGCVGILTLASFRLRRPPVPASSQPLITFSLTWPDGPTRITGPPIPVPLRI